MLFVNQIQWDSLFLFHSTIGNISMWSSNWILKACILKWTVVPVMRNQISTNYHLNYNLSYFQSAVYCYNVVSICKCTWFVLFLHATCTQISAFIICKCLFDDTKSVIRLLTLNILQHCNNTNLVANEFGSIWRKQWKGGLKRYTNWI